MQLIALSAVQARCRTYRVCGHDCVDLVVALQVQVWVVALCLSHLAHPLKELQARLEVAHLQARHSVPLAVRCV